MPTVSIPTTKAKVEIGDNVEFGLTARKKAAFVEKLAPEHRRTVVNAESFTYVRPICHPSASSHLILEGRCGAPLAVVHTTLRTEEKHNVWLFSR